MHSIEMLASFSEPIDVGERERKGEMEGVKERERKRERKKQRREGEKEEGRKSTAKKQKTTFLQSFLLMAYAKQGLLLL